MGVRRWTGHESRCLREAMRLSTRDFAARLGVAHRTIANWEAAGIDAALRPESQALLDTMLTSRASPDARDRFAGLLADQINRTVPGDLRRSANPALTLPTLTGTKPCESQTSPLEAALTGAGDESAAWLPAIEESNVGALTVDDMHNEVRRITGMYLTAPTLPLFERTRALRDRALSLLSGRQRPQQSRELYAVAGWSLTLLAWMTVDLGRPDLAERHTLTARACADSADHDGLRAWVCATQHTAAFWQDDYRRAAAYAAEGMQYATGSAAVFLSSAYALDLARSGQIAPAREALTVAKRAADELPVDRDEMAGPLQCSQGRAAGFWADTHLELDEPRPALEISDAAMWAFELVPDADRNRGSERMVRLLVGKAHLLMDEMDGAAEAIGPVLQTAPEHRVRPLLRRIGEVGALIPSARSGRTAITAGLRDQITEFIQTPAAPPA